MRKWCMKLWFWMWSDLSTIQLTILHGTEPTVPCTQFILCTDNVTVHVEFQLRTCQDLCYPYHENATFYSSLKQRRNLHWKKNKTTTKTTHTHPKTHPITQKYFVQISRNVITISSDIIIMIKCENNQNSRYCYAWLIIQRSKTA